MPGYYITESRAQREYCPTDQVSIRAVDEYNSPLDVSPDRCRKIVANWNKQYKEICENPVLTHKME